METRLSASFLLTANSLLIPLRTNTGLIKSRDDKLPPLIEDDRAGQEETCDESYLELGEESLGDAGADELDRPVLVFQQWPSEKIEQELGE